MPNQQRQATSAELREFLSQMRGKSPKEMLGAIASSNLVQSTFTATAAITAAIAVFTLGPFGLEKAFGKTPAASAPAEAANVPNKPLATPLEPSLDGNSAAETANKLGIGESEAAPKNVNPLESTTEGLLDGLE